MSFTFQNASLKDDIFICNQDIIDKYAGYQLYRFCTASLVTQQGLGWTAQSEYYPGPVMAFLIKNDGSMWSCGSNCNGQLGIGCPTTFTATSFVQVAGGHKWLCVHYDTPGVTGGGVMAIDEDRSLYAWGRNNFCTLGSSFTCASCPVQIAPTDCWKTIRVINRASLMLKTDGTLWGMGFDEYGSLLGNANSTPASCISVPTQLCFPSGCWKHISAQEFNQSTIAAINSDGELWTVGTNCCSLAAQNNSQTEFNRYSSPVQIGPDKSWCAISGTTCYRAAITYEGTLWSWGGNAFGALGINCSEALYSVASSPVQVAVGTNNWRCVYVGFACVDAIKHDSTHWAWGAHALSNEYASACPMSSPVQIGFGTGWVAMINSENALKLFEE